MKRRRNYSTTFNTATIGYVLQHLDALRTEPLSPVPVPKTLAKFLAVFPAASDFLTAVGTQAIREQLEGRLRVLTEARPLAWHAQEFQKYCEAFKPRSFAEFFDTRPPEQIGRSGHWQREFTWAAALHFWSQGDRSVTECPAGQDLVAGQCVTSPELLGRHPELAAAAGTSVTQLLAAREAVIALLRRYLDQLRVVPSVRWLAAVEAALPTFLTDQVSNFLGTGAVEDVVPAAEQAA